MAARVTVTLAEEAALEWAWGKAAADSLRDRGRTAKALESLLSKSRKARAPKVSTGLSLAAAETALAGCSKYAPFVGGDAAALCRQLARQGVTQEQLQTVGRWVDAQTWLQSVDLGLILAKWSGWLARAAQAPRMNEYKPAGFDDD